MKNKKLKPFNLEAALKGKPVVTRDGKPVKIAGYNPDAKEYEQLVGWIDGDSCEWSVEGKYTDLVGDNDLFMAAETVTRWVNVYDQNGVMRVGTVTFATESDAIELKSDILGKHIGAYPLTIEL